MPQGQTLFAADALSSLHGGVMLAVLLAAALIGFVLVVLLISLLRRHRAPESRPQRSASPADPWAEAGRRAHVEPVRPDRDASQESDQ